MLPYSQSNQRGSMWKIPRSKNPIVTKNRHGKKTEFYPLEFGALVQQYICDIKENVSEKKRLHPPSKKPSRSRSRRSHNSRNSRNSRSSSRSSRSYSSSSNSNSRFVSSRNSSHSRSRSRSKSRSQSRARHPHKPTFKKPTVKPVTAVKPQVKRPKSPLWIEQNKRPIHKPHPPKKMERRKSNSRVEVTEVKVTPSTVTNAVSNAAASSANDPNSVKAPENARMLSKPVNQKPSHQTSPEPVSTKSIRSVLPQEPPETGGVMDHIKNLGSNMLRAQIKQLDNTGGISNYVASNVLSYMVNSVLPPPVHHSQE